jgi:hypothetical protein
MRRQHGADSMAERLPAAQPVQRIIARRRLGAERPRHVMGTEGDEGDRDIDRHSGGEDGGAAARQQPGRHQHHRRNESGRRPISLGARHKAHHQHHRQSRQSEAGQQRRPALVETGARQQHDHDQAAKEQRPEDAELQAQELEELRRMEQRPGEVGVVAGVEVADEAVRRVPHEVRRIDQQRQRRGAEKSRQVAALVGKQQQEQQRREQPVRHGVLAEQAQSGGDADHDPPALAARLARADEAVERHRPAEQQRRVGREDHRRGGDAGQGDVGDRRPQGDARVVEPLRHQEDHQARAEMQQRRGKPYRPGILAEQPGGEGDEPGDHRRLGVVAEGGMQRPQPVLRFVGKEIGAIETEPDEARHADGKAGPEREAPRALLGCHPARHLVAADRHGCGP